MNCAIEFYIYMREKGKNSVQYPDSLWFLDSGRVG